MGWLASGVAYSIAYLIAGRLLHGNTQALLWLRICALLVPPLAGVVIIARRRHAWSGCQWLFWATIALGLSMSAIGIVGWTVDELLLGHESSWLGWYTVFALFGAVAPLFALLAQPHRGSRPPMMASTAVDVAGIAVMTGFLYSHFVVGSDLSPVMAHRPSLPLLLLQEFQQFVVCAAVIVAALAARGSSWARTYRRLSMGLFVNFVVLTVSNVGILQGLYRSGWVYDVVWILPFAFYAWAAASAPSSVDRDEETADDDMTPSRPWIVFGSLAALPLLDFGLRQALPLGSLEGFRDLSMVITIFSVLPLLMARLAVERTEARQENRKRLLLAAATEQADDLISIMTPEGRLEYANSAFCRALGVSPAEVSKMNHADLLGGDAQSQIETIRNVIGTGQVWRGTLVRRRNDQSTFISECGIVALTGPLGDLTNLVAVERDTTTELQVRDQLIHRERLAAVGQLVSGVAHELNNPLQAILGFTELLIVSERRQEPRSDLEQVRAAANRAAKIVRNLLAFVRGSSAERASTSLNDIVQSTIALRRYELATNGIQLEERYADDLAAVLVNREEIQQILLNVVLNAEHALRITGCRGRLFVRTTSLGSAAVGVDIEDDGPGIPPAIAGRIFEPFFTTKEVGQGTGLGLSLALGIAQAHGGSLTLVPSRAGACFRLTLPTAPVSKQSDAAGPIQEDESLATGRRALVVDDEEPLRLIFQRQLAKHGFTVDVAEDGQVALRLLQRNRYDVIFCDVQMPNMSGLDLFDSIRRRQPSMSSVFVFVTGGSPDPPLQAVLQAHDIPLLSKPFGSADLNRVLEGLQFRGVRPLKRA